MENFSGDIAGLTEDLERDLPPGDGPVLLRCDGDESCVYLAGLALWMERHGIKAQVERPFGVVGGGAPHRVHDGGPVRALLHVAIDEGFYSRALSPEAELLAYGGDAPTPARARVAEQVLALDAAYERGEIDAEDHFFARLDLLDAMGSGVGVMLEPLDS
jgi:hypothetical protein